MKTIRVVLISLFLASLSIACSDSPIQIDKTVTLPILVRKVEVEIPEILKDIPMKASPILLKAVITREGSVTDVKPLRPGQPLLLRKAISAVRRWKYKPALKNGKPVSVYFVVTVMIEVR